MISSEIFIIKRDGKKEAFSLDKIKNAISKAFLSVGSFATQDVITNVLSRVSISDGTNVEEIQNQVEVALMAEHYYSVAKAYMLYRQKHLEDREVRDKLMRLAAQPVNQRSVQHGPLVLVSEPRKFHMQMFSECKSFLCR